MVVYKTSKAERWHLAVQYREREAIDPCRGSMLIHPGEQKNNKLKESFWEGLFEVGCSYPKHKHREKLFPQLLSETLVLLERHTLKRFVNVTKVSKL
jgi:hypothetical protein